MTPDTSQVLLMNEYFELCNDHGLFSNEPLYTITIANKIFKSLLFKSCVETSGNNFPLTFRNIRRTVRPTLTDSI